jgi:hypothetical protein
LSNTFFTQPSVFVFKPILVEEHSLLALRADGTGCPERENLATGDTSPTLIAFCIDRGTITVFVTTAGEIFTSCHNFKFGLRVFLITGKSLPDSL